MFWLLWWEGGDMVWLDWTDCGGDIRMPWLGGEKLVWGGGDCMC